MPESHIVLVHGSWHTSWCWGRVVPLLTEAGHHVTTVDLPGREDPAAAAGAAPADYFATVVSAVTAIGEPVTLVGHSLGGVTISHVAEQIPQLVHRLIYVSAFIPSRGQSLMDAVSRPEFTPSLALRLRLDPETGISTYPSELAREAFYGETEESVAAEAVARLVPDGFTLAEFPAELTAAGVGRVERAYIECLRDKAVPIAAQRAMCRTDGISRVVSLDTDHSPFLSCPVEFVAALDDLAREAVPLQPIPAGHSHG